MCIDVSYEGVVYDCQSRCYFEPWICATQAVKISHECVIKSKVIDNLKFSRLSSYVIQKHQSVFIIWILVVTYIYECVLAKNMISVSNQILSISSK